MLLILRVIYFICHLVSLALTDELYRNSGGFFAGVREATGPQFFPGQAIVYFG